MNPYLALTRPGNMILTAIAVIAGSFIAAGPEIMDFQIEVAICCVCSMILVGGGNALNDYNDRKTDKENHPERPIPSGSISADTASIYAQALLGSGLLILLFALENKMPFVIALIGILLLTAYENGLKAAGISGNITVGLMSGAVFLFAGMAVNDPGPTLWMFGLAVLATITREIIKDIQDLEGDRDRRTLPASIGIENSMRVAILFLLIAIGLSYTAMDQFDGMASNAYLGGITLANGTMLFGIYNAKQEDYFGGQKNLKQGMGIAMLAFIAAAGLS
ncbi:MAG TPA: geranylgeranylglycerol-phosphate geranylgeranyltransferase [Candidatus Poseidoniia archaeon]|jgi:geranylgeranylglycerol-phosphate geranylgeranyltransferase|nr:geranylgeranylglycerol-phosphate geranylgeranyltransferase [Candidatus Poseidoniia archaeon]MDP7187463.1 geranylgeranylglycerol-phosphate geranylgeranyltransferase [Candidatus Poseidoniia archaeon]MDP7444993.1 geranylgeranylglycerol-phosphate geranylgeranyltransferase [Candidatus Poseidoniia archaeon]MDP7666138.1 geranylgeranylglycerol-phosphate geranylgeranyltransferase [Candidatus Poseidoniia archaeon]HJL71785.1 geranylgeranylglycerol-phosphate geranylgeranyltransferase [Candidatus Poseido|tara:strand:+ start:7421 stop:8254 length:834 start_codon:yes stop_codon:yes gene_type:complete